MAVWDYKKNNGIYSGVGDNRIRELIEVGTLNRDSEIAASGSERWQRLADTTFKDDCNRVEAKQRNDVPQQHRLADTDKPHNRNVPRLLLLFLLIGGGVAYYWYSERLTCSRQEVRELATSLVKEKLLKLTTEHVQLINIQTSGDLDSGGKRCTADVEITSGDNNSDTIFREVEFSVEKRDGNMIYVVGKMSR